MFLWGTVGTTAFCQQKFPDLWWYLFAMTAEKCSSQISHSTGRHGFCTTDRYFHMHDMHIHACHLAKSVPVAQIYSPLPLLLYKYTYKVSGHASMPNPMTKSNKTLKWISLKAWPKCVHSTYFTILKLWTKRLLWSLAFALFREKVLEERNTMSKVFKNSGYGFNLNIDAHTMERQSGQNRS